MNLLNVSRICSHKYANAANRLYNTPFPQNLYRSGRSIYADAIYFLKLRVRWKLVFPLIAAGSNQTNNIHIHSGISYL